MSKTNIIQCYITTALHIQSMSDVHVIAISLLTSTRRNAYTVLYVRSDRGVWREVQSIHAAHPIANRRASASLQHNGLFYKKSMNVSLLPPNIQLTPLLPMQTFPSPYSSLSTSLSLAHTSHHDIILLAITEIYLRIVWTVPIY